MTLYHGYFWLPIATLISVTSVSRVWRLTKLDPVPKHLIIDSGGFRYAMTESKPPSPRQVFQQQLDLIDNVDQKITLCALDHPMLPGRLSPIKQDRAIHRTIANAYEFKRLTEDHPKRENIWQMAVVQGYDIPSLLRCARELRTIGFDRYGIGSMAQLFQPEEIIARIQAVADILGQGLHVFGVSGVSLIQKMRQAGATSIDSTTPVTSAKYNILLYSNPYRRLIIADSRTGQDSERVGQRVYEALPCDCPACGGEANQELLEHGKRRHVYLRSLHNYWHLANTIRSL